MQKIIVVGGGYGGLRAIEKLASGNFSITLVDKNRFHYLQTESYKFLSGRYNIKDITSDLNNFCQHFKNVRFVQDEAVNIEENRLVCKKSHYEFDYLIIATGAQDFIPHHLKPYSYRIKEIQSAFDCKKHYLQLLYEEVVEAKQSRIVIGGAGQSGVELAGELMCIANECAQKEQESFMEITLIEAASTILPGSHPYIVQESTKRLKQLGVEVLTRSPIRKVQEGKIVLDDRELAYDIFIFVGGITPTKFIHNLPFAKDAKGFLKVDAHLQVAPNIFVIGDAAAILDKNGKRLPPTAQVAEQSAEYVASFLMNKKTRPFNGKIYGTFIEIGQKYAVGHLFGRIFLKGFIAYIIKQTITRIYALGIKIKTNSGYMKKRV